MSKHIFSCFVPNLQTYVKPDLNTVSISDSSLWRRIISVLRIEVGEQVILFDNTIHLIFTPDQRCYQTKNVLSGTINSVTQHQQLKPTINLFQAITKKSTFEKIVYSSAQLGIATIIPLLSKKIHRPLTFDTKYNDRIKSIMIAACEQSKQYVLPTLAPCITLDQIDTIIKPNEFSIWLDLHGKPLTTVIKEVALKEFSSINVIIGPEADFNDQERQLLQDLSLKQVLLTSTTLRSEDAVLVGIGYLRTLLLDHK